MKKQFTSGLLTILISLVAVPSYAQFANFPARAAKNLKNLERAVSQATHKNHPSVRVVQVPAGVVKGNRVALSRPIFASEVVEHSPVIASLRSVQPHIPMGTRENVVKYWE